MANGKPPPSSDTRTQADLVLDNNQLAAALFGPNNAHLHAIEQGLGVSIKDRANTLTISGAAPNVKAAEDTLWALYDRLHHGQQVEGADVKAALRFAESARGEQKNLPKTGHHPLGDFRAPDVALKTPRRDIYPRTQTQADYIRSMFHNDCVFGIGPAGTGKTYLAAALGVHLFHRGVVDRLVLCRPAVEAGERLGFLPGDLREKIDPYLRPLYDALYDTMDPDRVARFLENGTFEVAPLAFMRGRTLSNAFVILDEAQNTTPMQMKMFLTRLGEGSRMVITGDITQIDLPPGIPSGLVEAQTILSGVEGVAFTQFSAADVVRHVLVNRIVTAYDRKKS